MRSDPQQFSLSAAGSLEEALHRLAAEPDLTLMAGGTELMVAFNTGRLPTRPLLSIQHLQELRFLRLEGDLLHIGAGTTFTDIRRSTLIAEHFPLLAQAASWTGTIATQNRGTLGGNLCNASPAADSPPALLVYDAELMLQSVSGPRTMPYSDFHLGYKRTALQPGELLYAILIKLPRNVHHAYIRKVGARSAQAISKIALAGLARKEANGNLQIRLAAASLADRPLLLTRTAAALQGASFAPEHLETTMRNARASLAQEAHPIDDIRSTARYRTHVACNLLEEFLRELAAKSTT